MKESEGRKSCLLVQASPWRMSWRARWARSARCMLHTTPECNAECWLLSTGMKARQGESGDGRPVVVLGLLNRLNSLMKLYFIKAAPHTRTVPDHPAVSVEFEHARALPVVAAWTRALGLWEGAGRETTGMRACPGGWSKRRRSEDGAELSTGNGSHGHGHGSSSTGQERVASSTGRGHGFATSSTVARNCNCR